MELRLYICIKGVLETFLILPFVAPLCSEAAIRDALRLESVTLLCLLRLHRLISSALLCWMAGGFVTPSLVCLKTAATFLATDFNVKLSIFASFASNLLEFYFLRKNLQHESSLLTIKGIVEVRLCIGCDDIVRVLQAGGSIWHQYQSCKGFLFLQNMKFNPLA